MSAPSFILPSLLGRGYAMAHEGGRVTLNVMAGPLLPVSFSVTLPSIEARAIAAALSEAADHAETRQREARERIEDAIRSRRQ